MSWLARKMRKGHEVGGVCKRLLARRCLTDSKVLIEARRSSKGGRWRRVKGHPQGLPRLPACASVMLK